MEFRSRRSHVLLEAAPGRLLCWLNIWGTGSDSAAGSKAESEEKQPVNETDSKNNRSATAEGRNYTPDDGSFKISPKKSAPD